uniref:hypothetical protein n=1 Tax=Paractinoplanes polyasparticus TaxID=2856853 RepID=UPI001C865C9A|nr:hypothetical protein [Actinoplanes polyasparticus]
MDVTLSDNLSVNGRPPSIDGGTPSEPSTDDNFEPGETHYVVARPAHLVPQGWSLRMREKFGD